MASLLIRLVGLLLLLSALALSLSRAPDRPAETLVARWAPPPSDFVDIKGQIVHLRDEGPRDDPHPLVLLHGTASSLHTWEGWVGALRQRHRVITFDLPGFGLTGPFGGSYPPDDYRGDSYARFVIDLLTTLKLPPVVLGGHSLGGEVAWRVASLAPERVARLILVDASGLDVAAESTPLAFTLARLPFFSWLGQQALPRALVTQGLLNVYADPAQVTDERVDRIFELSLREGNRRALELRLQQAEHGAGSERLSMLTLPTLVLWGGRDRLTPPAAAQRFVKAIAGSELVMFPALGHVPQEEDAAATVKPVIAFLAPH